MDEFGDGGQDIDGHGWLVAGGIGGDGGGPFHDAGNTAAAIEHGAFAFAQWFGRAGVVAVAEPWSVVGGEDEESVVFDAESAGCFDELSDGPVDFGEDIGEGSLAGSALKFFRGEQGDMDHAVWQVQEERCAAGVFDELDGAFGVVFGEQGLFFGGDFGVDDFVVLVERQVGPGFKAFFERQVLDFGVEGPHVVAVRQAIVAVEAILQRQELWEVSEVPFAEAGGGVAFAAAEFSDGGFGGVDAIAGFGSESALDADADVVAAGHEAGAGGGADGLGDIEVGEAAAIFGELVEVWGD